MKRLAITLLVGLGLLGCCVNAGQTDRVKREYTAHEIGEIYSTNGIRRSYLFIVEIDGVEYYATSNADMHFDLGPKVERKVKNEAE